jgi:hypothetical protein
MKGANTTGRNYEEAIAKSLESAGYPFKEQVEYGKRPAGGRFMHDFKVEGKGGTVFLSVKYQTVGGTGDEKPVYENWCYEKAGILSYWIVLGGDGWRKNFKDTYFSSFPRIISWSKLIEKIEKGEL